MAEKNLEELGLGNWRGLYIYWFGYELWAVDMFPFGGV